MDAKTADIHFQLSLFGSRIELATYNEITRQVQIALQEHERLITGNPPHATWVLDTTAVIPVSASPNGTSQEDLRSVVRETWRDFARAVDPVADSSPSSRSRALAAVQSILAQLGDEVESIVVTGDDVEELTIDNSAITADSRSLPSQALAQTTYEDVGTVEGIIDLVSLRGKTPYFSLRQHWTGRFIAGHFDSDLIHGITSAFEAQQRVEITGLVKFRASGDPISVSRITDIRWTNEEPRDILAFEGVLPDLTGGMDEGEFVRRLRSGSLDE